MEGVRVGVQEMDRAPAKPASLGVLLRRIPVMLLLEYYIWILTSAWTMSYHWFWSIEWGLGWTSGGPGGFIPIPHGPGNATVLTRAEPIDQVFYLFFMHNGVWILWYALALFYIFYPFKSVIRTTVNW